MSHFQPEVQCPECGSELRRRNGKYGPFISCSSFPKCKFTKDFSNKPIQKAILWEDFYDWGLWNIDYMSVGSAPQFIDTYSIKDERYPASKVMVASQFKRKEKTGKYSVLVDVIKKILLRGEYAYSSNKVELELLKKSSSRNKAKRIRKGPSRNWL